MPVAATAAVGADGLPTATLAQDQFLTLLLTQLTSQDPMKPMDQTAFVAQMAQFSALAQAQQTNATMSSLLQNANSNQAISLLARKVDFINGAGTLTGKVTAMSFDSEGAISLTISDTSVGTVSGVGMDRIVGIKQP